MEEKVRKEKESLALFTKMISQAKSKSPARSASALFWGTTMVIPFTPAFFREAFPGGKFTLNSFSPY